MTEGDFSGAPPHLLRRVLKAYGVDETVAFFREIGVALHEEEHGKLFPDANRSRVVLQALLDEAAARGVVMRAGERVEAVKAAGGGFVVRTAREEVTAAQVVLATGGLSLPKSGSDGHGLRLAEALGHSVIPTTPALVPLVLAGSFHVALSGVAHEVEVAVRAGGRTIARRKGSLLWTHFGVSGPVVLDVSRTWLRARLEGLGATVEVNLLPGHDFAAVEGELVRLSAASPRSTLPRLLSRWLPGAVADAVARDAGVAETPVGRLRREERRALVHGLVARPLPVVDEPGLRLRGGHGGGRPARGGGRADDGVAARRRGSSWWARCWTWTAASGASTSSGRGRARGWRREASRAACDSLPRRERGWPCRHTVTSSEDASRASGTATSSCDRRMPSGCPASRGTSRTGRSRSWPRGARRPSPTSRPACARGRPSRRWRDVEREAGPDRGSSGFHIR